MLTVPAAGTVALNGTTLDQGYRLLNQGTASENTSAGTNASCAGVASIYTLCLAHGSTFENAGTWTMTGNGNFNVEADANISDAVLNDSGATLTSTANVAGATLAIDTRFTNAGTVNITTGRLQLQGNATATTDTGSYSIPTGTKLIMGGTRSVSGAVTGSGTLVLNGTETITTAQTIAGTVTVNSGSASLSGSNSVGSLDLEGGSLAGTLSASTVTLNGGTLTGSGVLTVPAAGTVALNGTTLDQGYRLLNQGTASENTSAGANAHCAGVASIYTLCLAHGSTFENAGAWTMTGNGNFNVEADANTGDAVLNDSGATLTATANTAGATLAIDTRFTNAGTVTSRWASCSCRATPRPPPTPAATRSRRPRS